MGGVHSSANSRKWARAERQHAESSRVLFLLYLVHRTWNVLMEHLETKSARWRGSHTVPSSAAAGHRFDSVSLSSSSTCSCRQDCAQDCVR